jgi:twitching motility protein PilJ
MSLTAIPLLVSTLLVSQVSQAILQDPLTEPAPEHIARWRQYQWVAYGIAGGVGLISWVIVIPLADRWTRPLQKLVEYGRKASQWDPSQTPSIPLQEDVFSQDEIGSLATYFKQILANSQHVYQQKEAQLHLATDLQVEQIENQKILLDVIDAMITGNLSTRAPVTSGVIGLLADALNRFIAHLNSFLASLSVTADCLKSQGTSVHSLTSQILGTTAELAHLLQEVEANLDPILPLSEKVDHEIQKNRIALQNTQDALREEEPVLNQLMADLADLRHHFEQMQRRTETLTDFVRLTSQFTRDQKRVAALTRVLALNASMLAARASGQQDPEQFASIAKEFETISAQVNDLALQTNQSLILLTQRTEQIQVVVSGLNQEIEEMGHEVNQISQGSSYSRQWLTQLQTATQEILENRFDPSQSLTQLAQKAFNATASSTRLLLQQDEAMQQMQTQVNQLRTLATTLLEVMQQFQGSQPLTVADTPSENGHGAAKTLPQPLQTPPAKG